MINFCLTLNNFRQSNTHMRLYNFQFKPQITKDCFHFDTCYSDNGLIKF